MTATLDPTATAARGRHRSRRRWTLLAVLGVAPFLFDRSVSSAQEPAPHAAAPDDPEGREVFLRVCARCHTADRVTAQGRTRAQWEEVMITMRTARAAMFTDEEFDTVLDYLARAHGPSAPTPPAGGRVPDPARRGPRAHVGAADRHRVDDAAADRGRKTYAAECVTCHGPSARGSGNPATNLVRSSLVLRDRYGSAIGPLLKKGHPTQSGALSSSLTDAQVADLSHFIWQRINDTLQGSPAYEPRNVLTGDPTAGRAYFTSEGRCTACHSPSGDLAGYGRRYSPVDIQQRFVFPGANTGRGRSATRKPVTVTVSRPEGPPISGALVSLDDFHVALRDAQGEYRSWTRTADMKIVKDDPLAAHVDLLYRLTDKTMHDVVAYLESLK
jgi:cytochrome c oxidase cbb3-type subunit III